MKKNSTLSPSSLHAYHAYFIYTSIVHAGTDDSCTPNYFKDIALIDEEHCVYHQTSYSHFNRHLIA
jgi:hypothetical protein